VAAAPIPATPVRDTLHVSPTGDDAAPGTAQSPLRSLARAAELARPGTRILVAAGRYPGPLVTTAAGTAGARISYVADPPGAAEVVATGSGRAAWANRGDFVDISGFTIRGDTGGDIDNGLLDEGSSVRLLDNRVTGFDGNCITTGDADYTLHDIDVIGNVTADCGRSSLDHGIYVSHPGGVVANNISYGNAGFGIHCWHNCNRLVISNNLVFDNATGGIVVGQGDEPNDGEVPADGFVVSNNIAVDNGGYGIQEFGATGADNSYLNNNVSGNEEGGLGLQTGREAGTLTTPPQFVDFRPDGGGDYRLRPGSPEIDAGTPAGAPDQDIAGATRPLGGGVDIGVYER
jgi:hypothetical protein